MSAGLSPLPLPPGYLSLSTVSLQRQTQSCASEEGQENPPPDFFLMLGQKHLPWVAMAERTWDESVDLAS